MQTQVDSVKRSAPRDNGSDVTRYGILLLREFPLYALIPAIEAMRIANQNRGRRLYDWQLISVDGQPVKGGNGMTLSVDASIAEIPWCPTVFVFGGNHPFQQLSKRLLNWLRKLARHGSVLGAVDTGAFALAEAGLLTGYQVTVHWETLTTFRDRYPELDVREQLYVIDRDRITCAGGHATLDMMLSLIARRHGVSLAQVVANGFVAQKPRRENEPQRLDAEHLAGDGFSPFARVLHDIEANIASPLSAETLAERAGVSVRALNRILRDRVGESPMRYYRKVRLQAARNALFYSDIPIQDIAESCGFASPEVFSRTFRSHFGLSPRAFRQKFTREELKRFRPEYDQQLNT